MAQQRRVMPAVGVAAVGLGIGAGALGLYPEAAAQPPRPATWNVTATPATLLAEGRELMRQNRLADALAKADAAAKLGGAIAPGGDTPDALRRDIVADGKQQIEELTAQAKVLATRGDKVRSQASLELARQVAAEIGEVTAPSVPTVVPAVGEAPSVTAPPPVQQAIIFHPAEPAPPVAVPPVEPAAPTAPKLPDIPIAEFKSAGSPPSLPALPTPSVPVVALPEKPLLPEVSPLSLNPSGTVAPPALPDAGESSPAPGATPVTLPKLAAAAVGAALAATPVTAQDATPKPGPGSESVVQPMTAPPTPAATGVSKEQFDALKADIDGLKDYKRQVEDLLQGKADGTGRSVLDVGILKRLTDLEAKLDRIEKAVESLRLGVTRQEPGRTALSPSTPAPIPSVVTPKTAVRLVNDYPTDLSIILNGSSHRLKPGETKTVGVPAGSFTYELIADGATPITRTIRDDETVTLRIK